MKIVFILCGIGRKGEYFLHDTYINHGVCQLSSYIKQYGYNDISCINLGKLSNMEEFTQIFIDTATDADVVALPLFTFTYDLALECIRIVKNINPNIKVIVGGHHPTSKPDEVLGNEEIDYVITGEGEIKFLETLDNIAAGRCSEKLIEGEMIEDLDVLPFIDDTLMGRIELSKTCYFPDPAISMITVRGCPYKCAYCERSKSNIFFQKVRRRSIKHVIAELIEMRDKYHFKSLFFNDDCFILNDDQFIESFCEQYKRLGFTQPFSIHCRSDIIVRKKNLIKLMAECGLKLIHCGVESGSQKVLNFLKKGTTVEKNIEASQICEKYGVYFKANILLGTPTETKEDVFQSLEMVREMKPYKTSIYIYTPMPGSELYDYCAENDLILANSSQDYDANDVTLPKIKGIDYSFLTTMREEFLKEQTFFMDDLIEKMQRSTSKKREELKVLMIRTAPVKKIIELLNNLNNYNVNIDLILQKNLIGSFDECPNIKNSIPIDPGRITIESILKARKILPHNSYDIGLLPLNSGNYQNYLQIYIAFKFYFKVRHILGFLPDTRQTIDLDDIYNDKIKAPLINMKY